MLYEVGDKLYWFELIGFDPEEEPASDAPERYATVVEVDMDGTVYFRFEDGVEDYMHEVNVPDYMERVTWDHKTS